MAQSRFTWLPLLRGAEGALAFIAALDLVLQAALPVAVWLREMRGAWAIPIGVAGVVAVVRPWVRDRMRRTVRPTLFFRFLRHGDAARAQMSEAETEALFWTAFVGERAVITWWPSVLGASGAVLIGGALSIARGGVSVALGAAAVSGGVLALRLRGRHALERRQDAVDASRRRASVWLAAWLRDRGEIRTRRAIDALDAHIRTALAAWTLADETLEGHLRVRKGALWGVVAVAIVVVVGPFELMHGAWSAQLERLALVAATIPAVITALRSAEDLVGARATLAGVAIGVPSRGDDAFPLPASLVCEATSLTVRYGDAVALDAVSITVPLDGLTCIVGPNGAGKTTLGAVLAGRLRATDGTLTLGGADPSRASADIAWVPQDPVLLESLSVAENVRLVAPDATDDELARALASFGLPSALDRACGTLSRGQQRRIALVRAVLRGARLLVLDEPDAWLDRIGSDHLENWIAEARSHVAIVVVTHRVGLALRADRVIVLDATHRLEALGPPAALDALSPTWRALRAAT